MKQDINPKNPKGVYHGCQEWYWGGSKLTYRATYKHGNEVGYVEYHFIQQTIYHIK